MSESTSRSVECPLCGEPFDPAAAGGWCTNSECGEWQYDGAIETTDEEDAPADEGSTDDVTDDPLFGGEDSAADEESPTDDHDDDGDASADDGSDPLAADITESGASDDSMSELDDEADAPDASTGSAVGETDDEAPDDEAEPEDVAAEPAAESDEEPEVESAAEPEVDDTADEVADEDALDACPECDTAVGPSDAFCPGCGEDLDAHRESDDEEELAETLDACPECGADVGPDDAFCASCGEDLDAHRGSDETETLDACPGCGGDVDPDDAFCASCGEDLDAHRAGEVDTDDAATDDGAAETGGSVAAPTPSSLALSAYGRSVVVSDDETVGRQIRSLLAETGQDEDQAVRIHREHVRFVRENDQFYVVDLGDNPTEVNGVRLSKGDREPIGPGDELGLSGVVTLDVEAP